MTPRTKPPNLASGGTATSVAVKRLRNQVAAPETVDFRDIILPLQSRFCEPTGAITGGFICFLLAFLI